MKVEKPEETEFERKTLENGTYGARIYSVIDRGTQLQREMINGEWKDKIVRDFKTKEPVLDPAGKTQLVYRREIDVSFELPSELITYEKDGEDVTFPMSVHKNYIISLHEKANLTSLAVACGIDIDNFDTDLLAGKEVLVTIGKTSGGKDKITDTVALPKGMEIGKAVNKIKIFSLDEFDQDVFDLLPEWQREDINKSQQRAAGGTDTV